MTRVKKELMYLKSKAEEAAGRLVNDDSVTGLQKEIKWFQGEAMALDKMLDIQKREFQKLKTKEKNINDDISFLTQQTKAAMKHNKLLEVALDKTVSQTSSLYEFLKRNKIQKRE
jgi:hypothetical protein